MTYADAQEELLKGLPEFREREPVSPRQLESLLSCVSLAVEDFDVATIESATRRSKASRCEISKAANKLLAVLQNLVDQLGKE